VLEILLENLSENLRTWRCSSGTYRKSVVLFVHDAFMLTKLKAKDTSQKEADIIVPLRLESIAVEELMLTCKSKALELKSVEEVEGEKGCKLLDREPLVVQREDIQSMDCIGRQSHDTEVDKETLEALHVRLLHESDKNAIVEDTIALLPLAVLDVGPVLVVIIHLGKTVGVSLLVEHLRDGIIDDGLTVDGEGRRASIRRHGEG